MSLGGLGRAAQGQQMLSEHAAKGQGGRHQHAAAEGTAHHRALTQRLTGGIKADDGRAVRSDDPQLSINLQSNRAGHRHGL